MNLGVLAWLVTIMRTQSGQIAPAFAFRPGEAEASRHRDLKEESMPSDETKFLLRENQIPTAWFNVVPSMPTPPSPPLHPGTMQPIGPDDLAPLFPMALIGQEVTTQEWIDIPGPVLDVYRTYRPSPLYRARR